MQLTAGAMSFDWNSNWAQVPGHITLGYTHGVAVDRQGLVHVFNQSQHAVVSFTADGEFVSTWDQFPSDRFLGAHGLTYLDTPEGEFFWLTDQRSCEVVKTTLAGETVLSLARPDHPVYREPGAKYSPTWVAESPVDGVIFVADGYGSGYISRYDKTGQYIDSFDGSAGAGRFSTPHGVQIFSRPHAHAGDDQPMLYVTDRSNARIQIFDLNCKFIRSFPQQHPCCFAEHPATGELLIPDLHAFVALYDQHDRIIDTLGDNREIVGAHGWPNVPQNMRVDGKFNSPHGGTFDHDGNLYIVEWIADGRITKLTRRP